MTIPLILMTATLPAGFLLMRRLQRGAHLLGGLMAAPAPVRAAAKRLCFCSQPNVHSIVSIHSADLCVAAMACAFTQMDNNATPAAYVLTAFLQKRLGLSAGEARDRTTVGAWRVPQGGGPTPAFERLTTRLKQLDHRPHFDRLMRVTGDVSAAGSKGMPGARQADAMGALVRIFRTA